MTNPQHNLVRDVIECAKHIHHWHDAMYNPRTKKTEGMVVSADAVRDLWTALSRLEKYNEG